MSDDVQQTWDDYYARIKARRMGEAEIMWRQLSQQGVTPETVLALDFVHFSKLKEDAEALADQLSENYNMQLVAGDDGYWRVEGTTRPEGVDLTHDAHAGWVAFMADVAHSHGCVFSVWSLEAPALGVKCSNEGIDVDQEDS